MGRRTRIALGAFLAGAATIWAINSSLLAPVPDGEPRLLAHRGVHQDFDRTGLTNESCTATRIRPPVAPQIENTIGSMEAAFSGGADVVELDVHPTTDGRFAVFHDWRLECRTDGEGETRAHDMAYLKSLDIGYGYTFDGGKTFPLRGRGVGLMPAFGEVMAKFPDGRFFVNFKSRDAGEGAMFAELLEANPAWRDRVWGVYGGHEPTMAVLERISDMKGATPGTVKSCLLRYIALGWSGHVPEACRGTIVMVPENFAPWLWGWPNRFFARMERAGSVIVLRGPYGVEGASEGIDTAEQARNVPENFPGYVWTNDIATVAPVLASSD